MYQVVRGLSALATGIMLAAAVVVPRPLLAAGTLTPQGSAQQPIQIRDHHVDVTINNGFARVEVSQTFFNPNQQNLEGIYSCPVPESGSLSEFSIYAGETEINGEVVPREQANKIYEEERNNGNDAGIANKNTYQNFEFKVAKIPAQAETRIRFIYYQPLVVDNGIGRFVYPLQDGGTDEVAKSFWVANSKVENSFSAQVDVRLAAQVEELRVPGFETAASIEKVAADHTRVKLQQAGGSLAQDLVVYYRLAQNLPGRIELLPYRADKTKPGSFMLVLTPGVDLKPITQGADYVFVLDKSGSMADKIATLARGVKQGLGQLQPQDRFRIVTFDSTAREITSGWRSATPEEAQAAIAEVERLQATDSTNLYEGLDLALKKLDGDRVTSVILVTDGVTNTGVIEPKEFEKLMQQYDVRLFGFLMGNSSNWPLMRLITESSGGFYAATSNADDIVGQIVLAKSKITSEALHHATLKISGVKTSDSTEGALGKAYRGQQVVVFGRYEQGGRAHITLNARLSGEDKVYETDVDFPELDTDSPEIERLWAMNRIELIERKRDTGKIDANEANESIKSMGVTYQLVTDETSMLVLSDEAFNRNNIARNNQARVAIERTAQATRSSAPVRNYTADAHKPMFSGAPSSHIFNGGGAIDPVSGGAMLLLVIGGGLLRRKKCN